MLAVNEGLPCGHVGKQGKERDSSFRELGGCVVLVKEVLLPPFSAHGFCESCNSHMTVTKPRAPRVYQAWGWVSEPLSHGQATS